MRQSFWFEGLVCGMFCFSTFFFWDIFLQNRKKFLTFTQIFESSTIESALDKEIENEARQILSIPGVKGQFI